MNFLIGQRVIYGQREIVKVIDPPRGQRLPGFNQQWVMRASGYEQCVSLDNLKPLPGGQL
jgi:hypothetical protein